MRSAHYALGRRLATVEPLFSKRTDLSSASPLSLARSSSTFLFCEISSECAILRF